MQRLLMPALLMILVLVAACTSDTTTPEAAPIEATDLLAEAVSNVQELKSFHMLIEQRGGRIPVYDFTG